MIDTPFTLETSFADFSKDAWLDAVVQVAQDDGFYETLGRKHHAIFLKKTKTLLVSFETISGMRALSSLAHPLGWEMVRNEDWSHLCIASEGDTCVVFYGAGPGGYAAAAYSVAAPGARVVAIQPQATLDPSVAEWDDRFIEMRRTDFTSRFGYAPEMLDAAEAAYVIYDPAVPLDAMHASLFTRPNVTKLRMRRMGSALQSKLLDLDQFEAVLTLAAEDDLTVESFARCARARRDHRPYLRSLLNALEQDQRETFILMLCRWVNERISAPRFARRQKQIEADIALRNAPAGDADTDQDEAAQKSG